MVNFAVQCGYTTCLWEEKSVNEAIIALKRPSLAMKTRIHLGEMEKAHAIKPDIEQFRRDSDSNIVVWNIECSLNLSQTSKLLSTCMLRS